MAENSRKKNKQFDNFDFILTLRKLCKNKIPIVHTTFEFSKSLNLANSYGGLFAQSGFLQNPPREHQEVIIMTWI